MTGQMLPGKQTAAVGLLDKAVVACADWLLTGKDVSSGVYAKIDVVHCSMLKA